MAAGLLAAAGCDRVAPQFDKTPPAVSAGRLKAAATDEAVRRFYEARQWRAAWSGSDETALLEALEAAPRHGFDASRFNGMIRAAEDPAERDASLTLAALTYADALGQGVLDPRKLFEIYAIDRPKTDAVGGLAQALQAHGVEQWLDGLAPQDADYRRLSDTYLGYKALAAAPIPDGPALQLGASDARSEAVARWLRTVGYLPAGGGVQGAAYDPAMAGALRAMQAAAKLPLTGQPDAASVKRMNDSAALRAKQLAVNLERRRWLPRDVPATRIDVNTAAAELTYLHDGQVAWRSRTVVGDPDPEHQTPQLFGAFDDLVANPPWVVPKSIAEKEIFPKGPDYMARENMRVEDGQVIQAPGPDAALGLVKFDMQNPHAIYLHDTPAKALFASDARHRSHGCARVERAVDFARLLAEERGRLDAFDKALAAGETATVQLGEKIPVRLVYFSVYADPAGTLVFTDDPYGWDDIVAAQLGLGTLASTRAAAQPVAHLLGP